MARTIAQIRDLILEAKANEPLLDGLDSTSVTAIWRLWIYIVASSIWALENLFDIHKTEVAEELAKLKPHTLKWYVGKSKLFQFGSGLASESDEYDNTSLTDAEIEVQQVVKYAAAVEVNRDLHIKLATEVDNQLEPLTQDQYNAFVSYINTVKDAGVFIQAINNAHDKIKLTVDIYYDPTILNATGGRLDGANSTPVNDAINDFLKSLPFNGVFVKAHLTDAMQRVEGVYVPQIRSISATKNDSESFTEIDISYQPFSGYLKFVEDADLLINYIPQ